MAIHARAIPHSSLISLWTTDLLMVFIELPP